MQESHYVVTTLSAVLPVVHLPVVPVDVQI
jgi:hypothetical protein